MNEGLQAEAVIFDYLHEYKVASNSGIQLSLSIPGILSEPLCPQGYEENPYSGTCFRRVEGDLVSWDAASAACKAGGETLAVFDTVDSIEWFKNLRHTVQGRKLNLCCLLCTQTWGTSLYNHMQPLFSDS